jgi:hypothetical protein
MITPHINADDVDRIRHKTLVFNSTIQTYLGDIAGSVPDHHNEANITIKRVTQIFWFPSAYENYVYTIL